MIFWLTSFKKYAIKVIGIFGAKTKLSKICEEVVATGEPSVIAKHGEPIVKIIPYHQPDAPSTVWDTIEEAEERFGNLNEDLVLPERTVGSKWGRRNI